MSKRHQLALGSESLQRLALKGDLIAVDVVQHGPLKDEEPTVDPTRFGLWFLRESSHLVAVQLHCAESGRRSDRCHGRQATVALVEAHKLVDVDVSHAVAVGNHEASIQERGQTLD